VGSGGLFQRERGSDGRGQLALKDQVHYRHKVAVWGHRAADNRDVFAEQVTQIDLCQWAAGVAHDEDTPAFGYSADTAEERFLADVIHDHVHAALIGQPENGLRPVLDAAVDALVSAERDGLRHLVGIAAHHVDFCAREFSNLDAGGVDAATRPNNQYAFSGSQTAFGD